MIQYGRQKAGARCDVPDGLGRNPGRCEELSESLWNLGQAIEDTDRHRLGVDGLDIASRRWPGGRFAFLQHVSATLRHGSVRRGDHSGGPAASIRTGLMTKTVLIVEDNELNMKLFSDLLEAHGYATLKTANGIEAIEIARAHHPDLILMDIQLPEVSGLDVTRWLKEDDDLKAIPVIAITAFAMKGDEERIREGGCEAYLSKPISVAKFLATVRAYLEPR